MFNLEEKISVKEATAMNPVVLAFVGDAVYSLYIREKLAFNHDLKAGELNRLAVSSVRASAQAQKIENLLSVLTEEELAVFRRARNAKKGTKAKSASVAEYNLSTGFEAVVGYLYVTGQAERLDEILNYGEENEG